MNIATDAEIAMRLAYQEHLAALNSEFEPGWEEQFQPGTFGCHELLDRTHALAVQVESQILEHPACALREEWYRLAERAFEALRNLYQRVGAVHLGTDDNLNDNPRPVSS